MLLSHMPRDANIEFKTDEGCHHVMRATAPKGKILTLANISRNHLRPSGIIISTIRAAF